MYIYFYIYRYIAFTYFVLELAGEATSSERKLSFESCICGYSFSPTRGIFLLFAYAKLFYFLLYTSFIWRGCVEESYVFCFSSTRICLVCILYRLCLKEEMLKEVILISPTDFPTSCWFIKNKHC